MIRSHEVEGTGQYFLLNTVFSCIDPKVNDKLCIFSKCISSLRGTATLMITMFYMRDLNKPWILIPIISKSVEKRRCRGHLNICKWTVMEAAIL